MTIKEQLNQNIPAESVEKRQGGNGKELSYLTGAYVINRLNEVLGAGGWGYTLKNLTKTFEGKLIQGYKKEEVFATSYIVQLSFEANVEGKRAFFEEVGYGDGTDKANPGKAHELATKEAITDALKRAAKNLGISFGLGLYFKSGEYVDETVKGVKSEDTVSTKHVSSSTVTKSTESRVQAAPATTSSSPVILTETVPTAILPSQSAKPFTDTKILRTKIKSAFAVLEAQKKVSKTEFVKEYLGGGKVDTITDDQVSKTLEKLKTNFKELGL